MNNIERLRTLMRNIGYDSPTLEELADAVEALKELDGDASELEFSIDGVEWRAIHGNDIDEVMTRDLEGDEFVIGCCASWLLANVLELPLDSVELLQEEEQFYPLGRMVTQQPGKLAELQREIVKHDGYGPHFSPYDGEQQEFESYYIFRVG